MEAEAHQPAWGDLYAITIERQAAEHEGVGRGWEAKVFNSEGIVVFRASGIHVISLLERVAREIKAACPDQL